MAWRQSGFHIEVRQLGVYVLKGLLPHQVDLFCSEDSWKIGRHIKDLLDHEYLPYVDQHAYRAGFLTEMTLYQALCKLWEQFDAKGYVMGALIDIEGRVTTLQGKP